MKAGILGAPRPEPNRIFPVLAGALVVVLALLVFLTAGWRLTGWTIAAVLWVGVQALALLLARFRPGQANLAASGVLAFGMMFRVVAVMVVLVAVASSNARVALAAAVVYALAYTAELGLSLAGYYGQEPTL
jgi:hypothetical protein